ncbi:hypothetical protein [Fluviicola sp.]|uniref:hypothetical protein n=1 Tax=Fluviicola sp. TaxID=1917219 RepID=UPI0028316B90|nr:hypothetical protein [Fluviicola sp.]MDR0801826.1 hypothetical protein [Fluviicola sp.]
MYEKACIRGIQVNGYFDHQFELVLPKEAATNSTAHIVNVVPFAIGNRLKRGNQSPVFD